MGKWSEHWRTADGAYTAASWIWWGVERVLIFGFGLTGATLMAWAFSQVSWFWNTFQWAGVLFIGLVTWILIGIGLSLYRRPTADSTRVEGARRMEPLLWVAGVAAIILVGSLVAYSWKAHTTAPPTPPVVTAAPKVPLTEDQRQFRIGQKQFSLICVPNLENGMARVFRELKTKEAEISKGSPSSVALHFFIHFAMNTFQTSETVRQLGGAEVDAINVEELQSAIQRFFSDYEWRQSAVADLNEIVKVDLLTLEWGKRWFAVDNECRAELQKLKIWPEAIKAFKLIDEDNMASGRNRLWATQRKVNYQ